MDDTVQPSTEQQNYVPDNLDETNQKKDKTPFLIGISVFLLLFVGLVFLLVFNKKPLDKDKSQTSTKQLPTVSESIEPKTYDATSKLRSKNAVNTVNVGSNIVLVLSFDSKGTDVVAYDALIEYDKTLFEMVSVQSLISDFKIYDSERENRIALTGVKSLSSTEDVIFENKDIAAVTFKALKKGSGTFKIVDKFDNESSQIVDKTSTLKVIEPFEFEVIVN